MGITPGKFRSFPIPRLGADPLEDAKKEKENQMKKESSKKEPEVEIKDRLPPIDNFRPKDSNNSALQPPIPPRDHPGHRSDDNKEFVQILNKAPNVENSGKLKEWHRESEELVQQTISKAHRVLYDMLDQQSAATSQQLSSRSIFDATSSSS